jgi:acyl-CoA reductase-like NAD-dependent aldehyde dehydrogenase
MSTAVQTEMLASLNPATGEVVGEVAVTPVGAIPEIVSRSRAAQKAWGAMTLEERMAVLAPAGAALEARAESLGEVLTREMGKPLAEGVGEVKARAHEWEAELQEIVDALQPVELKEEHVSSMVYRDPFGVSAAITPWNFPILMPHQQLLPALIAGNTVVFKPSEETPLSGQGYADVLNEFLPPDVLQVVHGADDQGKALVAADVELITFTGSREVGKMILAAASGGLKRVILELGGKDPLIVLDDADLETAASFAASNSFWNAGQVCFSTERIYVQKGVAGAFVDLLKEQAEAFTPGDGMVEGSTIGPMVNARQRDHVLKQIDEAVEEGATVAYGGSGHHGNFVQPTILSDVTQGMGIAREETFGPVACVIAVDSDDEALAMANDSPYGLGAVVFGGEARARKLARHLTAGMIGVNRGIGGASGTPWVGARESGFGFHSGPEGHRQFAQVRVVSVG